MKRKEVDYYNDIAIELVRQIESNAGKDYIVKAVIGEIRSGLMTLIANGYNAGQMLSDYAKAVHRLHLDIAILIENPENGKFEIIIFEIKKVKNLGLGELSQLIGYCLVSKSRFGILINIDNAISSEFSIIIDADKDLTNIDRIIDGKKLNHKFGVMVWDSSTLKITYTNSGEIKSIPDLVKLIEEKL